ncbi:hypothetical protein MNB_SV-15-825 [hydrothermal vent metagenome]|uniref:Uncharacterized protein n=1 Tax=hydrothermal vent metagenome TaxID=652676 RepID=A0A1W1EK57_9ZZZZ
MEKENIIILSMAVIMAMQPIYGDDIKKLDDKPVDEGKTTEILRGGTIEDSNISIEIKEDIIEIKIEEISHLPITMTIIRDDKEIKKVSSENEDEIIFEIKKSDIQIGDKISISNRFEEIKEIRVEE